MDKEIVSHRALSDSVVRVEYEGGSEIYKLRRYGLYRGGDNRQCQGFSPQIKKER